MALKGKGPSTSKTKGGSYLDLVPFSPGTNVFMFLVGTSLPETENWEVGTSLAHFSCAY
jgi:hypothetical protein